MINLAALKRAIAVAIITDAAIIAHCSSVYKKAISVAIGLDLKSLPKADNVCPWVGLAINQYERPTANNKKTASIELDSAVYIQNETISQDSQYTTLYIAAGDAAIETLSDLVFAAIERVIVTSSTQLTYTYVSEGPTRIGMVDLPEFAATRSWTIGVKA